VLTPSVFAGSSSSDKTDSTLSLFTGRSGNDFVIGSIRAGGAADVDLQEIYIPEWFVTKGFELNDGQSCANMIDHFTPPAFFKTIRGMEHGQLFVEFNVSAARNLSLSFEVRMRAEYNILEKRKWKSLAEEKNNLLQVKDKKIEELSLEAIEGSLRGEVASSKEHNDLLKQERSALKLKVSGRESIIAEKDRKLSDLGTSSASLRLAKIDADFTSYGMKLLMAKCLNSTEYMEALGNAFGRAIEKRMQEGLAAGIKHGQAKRCLSDLEAYNPSAEADFNSAVRDLRGLDFPLLRELSAKKDASTWDVMDLLRLDDVVAKVLGMTDLQRVRKMERNLTERLPFLKDVFVYIDHPLSTKALTILPETSTEPPDYENPDLAGAVPEDVIPRPKGGGKVGGSTKGDVDVGDLVLSQLENVARDAVL
ncbi:hypothetical protein Tco_1331718, partial [Tanacetum coccineum]